MHMYMTDSVLSEWGGVRAGGVGEGVNVPPPLFLLKRAEQVTCIYLII